MTVGIDSAARRVIHVGEGKDANSVAQMKKDFVAKGLDTDTGKQVCIDMSPDFISGVIDNFPKSGITFDRFHVKNFLNEAVDKVRQQELKGNGLLKNHKYTFLRDYENLSSKKKGELDYFTMMYPKLGNAYRLKVLFDDFWENPNVEEAQGYLAFWCDYAIETKIKPLIESVKTVKAHWYGIVNYLKSRITAGAIEGINNKIQLAKRRARGYRNINNFINMIYFLCGKLKFDYPHYPL